MIEDPIVNEVRRIREEYGAQFGHDLNRIFEDLRRQQEESGMKVVSRPPRKPIETPKAKPDKAA